MNSQGSCDLFTQRRTNDLQLDSEPMYATVTSGNARRGFSLALSNLSVHTSKNEKEVNNLASSLVLALKQFGKVRTLEIPESDEKTSLLSPIFFFGILWLF